MIEETIIESAAESIGSQSEENYQKMLNNFKEKHPVILAYIFSKNLDLLTSEERHLLLYFVLVTRKAILKIQRIEPPQVTAEQIAQAEDENWSKIVDNNSRDFRERLTPFFEQTKQEDLLAFFEDVLVDEEEEWVTKAGREYIFVGAKTIVDVWVGG